MERELQLRRNARTFDCEGVANGSALPGTPCNDGNSNTINDVWSATAPALVRL
ncbi:MAG: hypothetical protein R2817_08920 [Flavobacteriales bacterium]